MAVAYIMEFAGGTAADYDAVMERMALGDRLPPGALFHAAGEVEGGLLVCDVWEDADAFGRFAEAQIGPHTAAVGLQPPRTRSFPVNELRRGGKAGPVAFVQAVTMPGLDADGFLALDRAILGAERRPPADCVFHVNGRLEDGSWCVVDAWTSKDVRDRFLEERVRPAVAATGTTAVPSFEEALVHNALTERAAQAVG